MTVSSKYRTELAAFLLDLLDFMEEKLAEAADLPSRQGALAEAAGAIPVIADRLRRENDTAFAQLMLIGFIEADLGQMAGLPEGEFAAAAGNFRACAAAARAVIAQLEVR
jgi:hypothetical protein